MPKQAKPKWCKTGVLAAQLFRDFYFGKYNDTTLVTEIHEDKDRNYGQLSLSSFYTHVKNTRNRVTTYRQLGTGLESEAFRLLVDLDHPPEPQDQAPAFSPADLEEGESDDDSYTTTDDEDDDSIGSVTLESAFASINLRGEISDAKVPGKKGKKKTTPKKMPRTETSKAKFIVGDADYGAHQSKSADGRLYFAYHLPSGWDGTIFVNEEGTALMEEVYVPRPMRDAVTLMAPLEVDENDVHMVEMKMEMKRKKKMVQEQGAKSSANNPNMVLKEQKLMDLPCKVLSQVYDCKGEESDEVTIETYTGGAEIAHIFLRSVDAKSANPRPRVRRNRNRNRNRPRNRDGMDDDSGRRTRHRDNNDGYDDPNMQGVEVPEDSS